MNGAEAAKLDVKGEKYVDFDEESDCWGVFGSESGFCYSLHCDMSEAYAEALRSKDADSERKSIALG